MSTDIRICLEVTIKETTPLKIKKAICAAIRERYVPVADFDKCCLSFEGTINYSYSNVDYLERLTLPTRCNKYVEEAKMTITYVEQAPTRSFNLVEYEYGWLDR